MTQSKAPLSLINIFPVDTSNSFRVSRTAVLGALFNVKINLESIKDEEFVKETSKEVEVLEKKAIAFEQKILAQAQVSKSVVE